MTDRSPDVARVAQIVPNFRVRTIPVLGTMPAIFGLAAASYILCQLAEAPFQPEPVFRLTEGQYETQLQRLTEREGLVYGNSEGPAVDLDDVSPPSRRFQSGLGALPSKGQLLHHLCATKAALGDCYPTAGTSLFDIHDTRSC